MSGVISSIWYLLVFMEGAYFGHRLYRAQLLPVLPSVLIFFAHTICVVFVNRFVLRLIDTIT